MNAKGYSMALAVLMLLCLPMFSAAEPQPKAERPAPVKGWMKVVGPTVKSNASGTTSAMCPAGKKALGGGYHISGGSNTPVSLKGDFYVSINRPTDKGDGWLLQWISNPKSSDRKNFWVNAFAICADAE